MDTRLPRTYWRHVAVDPNGCWNWTGNLNTSGYGRWFGWGNKATPLAAHVVAYTHLVGPVPDGLQLDHLCHTHDAECLGGKCAHRTCVNPAHLEPVTARENLLRSPHTQAARNAAKTHCDNGHEFTPENTYYQTEGAYTKRRCRACKRKWAFDDYHAVDGTSGT